MGELIAGFVGAKILDALTGPERVDISQSAIDKVTPVIQKLLTGALADAMYDPRVRELALGKIRDRGKLAPAYYADSVWQGTGLAGAGELITTLEGMEPCNWMHFNYQCGSGAQDTWMKFEHSNRGEPWSEIYLFDVPTGSTTQRGYDFFVPWAGKENLRLTGGYTGNPWYMDLVVSQIRS